MPRQKNTRPTNIYWLYDTRPEKVAEFGPLGEPFYCGKTINDPSHRFAVHQCDARRYPDEDHSVRINACGEHITIRVIDIVAPEHNWCASEQFWIATLHYLYPGGTNIRKGGEGAPGWIPSAAFREKARLARCARNKSPEFRAKISAALKGRIRSAEHCAAIAASKRGKPQSAEANAKRSATQSGRTRDPEAVAKTRAALLGRKRSPQECANISAGRKGISQSVPHSPEHRASISAYKKAWWANPVNREYMRLKQLGRQTSKVSVHV